MSEESGLQGWHRFIGRWETEGAHPMLPGEPIRGTSTFQWLDGKPPGAGFGLGLSSRLQ